MKESILALQLVFHLGRGSQGRRRLAEATGASEMTVRLELERLRESGFVALRRLGAALTDSGRNHFERLLEGVREIRVLPLTTLRIDRVALAAHLAATEKRPVWLIRDAAIREGASGLVLLRYDSGGWQFVHDEEPVALRNPQDAATLRGAFPNCTPGDRLVLCFGPDRRFACLGLWRAIDEIVWRP